MAIASSAVAAGLSLAAAASFAAGSTFTVNSTADAIDAQVGDGVCRTSAGTCTLRAAIQEANALSGADLIQVPSGTYAIAIPPQSQNDITSGDFDITDSVRIVGAGAGSTVIDAGAPPAGAPPEMRGLDRIFEVLVEGGEVTFASLSLTDGYAAEYGGAILNNSSARVTVTAAILTGHVAGKTGGAIDNHLGGAVEVSSSTLSRNHAAESGSALNNNRGGVLTITDSTISGNSAAAVGLNEVLVGAGAISNNAELDTGGTIAVSRSNIADNASGGGRSGAAISNDGTGSVTIDQTTFTKNQAAGNGGAIFNGSGTVTITASIFAENSATDGGAIASTGGELNVAQSSFSKNAAGDWGGGIFNGNLGAAAIGDTSFTENSAVTGGGFANEGTGLVTVENSSFTKNNAVLTANLASGEGGGMHSNSGGEVVIIGGIFTENSARDGGGLSNEGGGRMAVTGTRFAGNRAQEAGGGILVQGGDVRMVNIDVVGNVSESQTEGGGGISYAGDKSASIGESAAIEGSRIRDNKANGDGGGIDSRGDGPLAIVTTAITGNTAAVGGGIHHVGDAPLELRQSTVSGNLAESGAGLFTDGDGEATLENATVSGNRAGQFGGGILVSARLTVRNSTVASNTAATGGGINNGGGPLIGDGFVFLANTIVASSPTGGNCVGTITSRGGNVENMNSCGLTELSDQPGTDPRLGPLADNGGATQTHALLADSPAQDRAACTEIDPCPELDQRGVSRPLIAGFDAGAYESELAPGGGEPQRCAGLTERPVTADFDSWISQGSPSSNFGADSILNVDSSSGASERALVHFPLPPVPPGCRLVGATLRMYSPSATAGRTLQTLRIASGWNESSLTWSNQPTTAGPPASTPSGLQHREWDVLSQTLDMYALGAHGFLIRDALESGSSGQSFHSTEKGTESPVLLLVFDDPDAPPASGTCPTTPQIVSADRDSWISEGSPANNFGNDSTLKVKSQGGSNSRALLHFPLPTLPGGCTSIASAVLSLEATSAKDGRSLEVRQVASAWSEGGVTWSNRPATAGPAAVAPSAQGVLEWDVTAQLLGLYASANHGLMIQDGAEGGAGDEQSLNSRDKVTDGPPQLLLVFDDTTPETTIELGPVSPTDEADATFTFTSDRTDATFECSLDGAPFEACESPLTLPALAEGDHALEVRATRRVRAVDPTPASHEWMIAIPPETTISGPASPSATATATIAFFADDPDATFECALNQGASVECTSPIEYAALADGDQVVIVRATDPLGNVEPEPASHTWTVAVPPETTITDQAPNPTNATAASFTFTGTDNGTAPDALAFECRLDSAEPSAFGACPVAYSDLHAGDHTFEVRATDRAGHTDPSPASYTWTIDLTPPEVTIDDGPADPTNATSARFVLSGSDNHSAPEALAYECRLDGADGAAFGACPIEYRDLAVGAHTFELRASDAAGNVASAVRYTWVIDLTPPVAAVDAGPADPTNARAADFAFSADEPASFTCALDGAPATACAGSATYTELAEGAHSFQLVATDAAGNVAEPATYSWAIDLTPPQTTIVGPDAPTNATSASFTFAADEPASLTCALDGATPFACDGGTADYHDLAEGEHSFAVTATDAAGNVAEPATYTWTIDTTPPSTTISGGPIGLTNDATPTFEFSAEPGASLACRLDADEYAACGSPYEVSDALTDGSYRFEVKATDAAGNEGTVAAREFTVDTTSPDTTIDDGPADPTNATSATFVFRASEAASLSCALDASEPVACDASVTYGGLPEGPHTFTLLATDAAGNTDASPASHIWTIDTTPPETTITGGPSGPTNEATPSFEFSSEPGADLACRLGAAEYAACGSPYEVTEPLADGAYRFEVKATDAAGNEGIVAAREFTVDTTSPDTTIDDGPADPTNATTAGFAFSASEAASFACALDGAEPAACNGSVTYSGLPEGPHTFTVRATDAAGNVEDPPASHTWTIDTSPPTTTITDGPSGLTNDATPSFEFSAEQGASLACRLGGAQYSACDSPYEVTEALADGTYRFEVKASDAAGNEGPATARDFTVDTVAPTISALSGPANPTTERSAQFTFSADDGGASFACKLDTGGYEPCASGIGYEGPLALGDHMFAVKAVDAASNEGTPETHAWTIEDSEPPPTDSTPPETTLGADTPADPTNATTASFTFSATDNETSLEAMTFECRLDSMAEGAWRACTSPDGHIGLADGSHTFEVRAIDAASNADASPATYSWTIDTAPPQTTISGGPTGQTQSTSASFTFGGSDTVTEPSDLSFECALDDAAFEPCTSPVALTGVAGGPHTFRVRATDRAGNTDPDAAVRSWTVDTTAPETLLGNHPANPSNQTSATFTFTGTDNVNDPAALSFQCRLDAAAFASCTSPRAYTGLSAGAHTFEVRASDAVGNVDTSPARHVWTIDTIAPNTTITGGPAANSTTTSTSASFTFTASETGSTFQCSLDSTSAYTTCTSPRTYTGLTVGSHTFRVRAIDAAGNLDGSPSSRAWTIQGDTTPPNTTITGGPASGSSTTSTSASFTFTASETGSTFQCSLDSTSAYAACGTPQSYTALNPGIHTFRVRAIDAAGNVDATPASRSWTVEATSGCGAPITLVATADAWIQQNSSSSNKGSDSILKVKSQGPTDNFRALVTFALPGAPADCVLGSATLRLFAASATSGRTIEALRLNGPWTEAGATWSNQPATTGPLATTSSGGGNREWNVTTHVQGMYEETNHGFLIRDAAESGSGFEQQFHSREKGEQPPQLVLTFSPVSPGGAFGGPVAGTGGHADEPARFEPARVEPALLTIIQTSTLIALVLATMFVSPYLVRRRPGPLLNA